jgi:hypothetical protein
MPRIGIKGKKNKNKDRKKPGQKLDCQQKLTDWRFFCLNSALIFERRHLLFFNSSLIFEEQKGDRQGHQYCVVSHGRKSHPINRLSPFLKGFGGSKYISSLVLTCNTLCSFFSGDPESRCFEPFNYPQIDQCFR